MHTLHKSGVHNQTQDLNPSQPTCWYYSRQKYEIRNRYRISRNPEAERDGHWKVFEDNQKSLSEKHEDEEYPNNRADTQNFNLSSRIPFLEEGKGEYTDNAGEKETNQIWDDVREATWTGREPGTGKWRHSTQKQMTNTTQKFRKI